MLLQYHLVLGLVLSKYVILHRYINIVPRYHTHVAPTGIVLDLGGRVGYAGLVFSLWIPTYLLQSYVARIDTENVTGTGGSPDHMERQR